LGFAAAAFLLAQPAVCGMADNPRTIVAPDRSIALPVEEVEDVFFAYIVGLLIADATLDIDGAGLIEMFPEFAEGDGKIPFDEIERVTRTAGDPATVSLEFANALDYPVPVDILGYHPGRVLTSRYVFFREEPYDAGGEFEFVRLEWVIRGRLALDFDNWLDTLLGRLVDDVEARVAVALSYEGHWYALLGGDTPGGGWITGVYDLPTNRILVRPPRALRELGDHLAEYQHVSQYATQYH
jgi:hypothetical protein